MSKENAEHPILRLSSLGSAVTRSACRLDDLANALYRVGMEGLAGQIKDEAQRILNLGDEIQKSSGQAVSDYVHRVCEGTDAVFRAALSGLELKIEKSKTNLSEEK